MSDTWDLFNLKDRVFLVVGGARTLGLDMAAAMGDVGADGVITSRSEESAQAAAEKLSEATGSRIEGLGMDATDEQQVRAGVEEVVRRLHQTFFSTVDPTVFA